MAEIDGTRPVGRDDSRGGIPFGRLCLKERGERPVGTVGEQITEFRDDDPHGARLKGN